MRLANALLLVVRTVVISRAQLAAENLALRQQLVVLTRSVKRPHLRRRDRIFWSWLSRIWPDWRSAIIIVKPETVIRWHRQGFRLYWRWKSRRSRSLRRHSKPDCCVDRPATDRGVSVGRGAPLFAP